MVNFFKELTKEIGVKKDATAFWILIVFIILLAGGIVICIDYLGIGEIEYFESVMLKDIKYECGTKKVLVLEDNIFDGGKIYRLKEVPKICYGKAFADVRVITKHWWEIKK